MSHTVRVNNKTKISQENIIEKRQRGKKIEKKAIEKRQNKNGTYVLSLSP